MMDWIGIASGAAWIFACALALAVLSIANWQALHSGSRLRDQLKLRRNQAALGVAGVLFCLGMAGSAGATWERVAWVVLAVGGAVYTWRARPRIIPPP